jgi:iron complex transport system substrate-binding protein
VEKAMNVLASSLYSKYIDAMKKLAIILSLLFFFSCHQRQRSNSAGVTFTDDVGREVTFEQPPKRIVSLAPSLTEICFAIDSGTALVGVTQYCNYPPETRNKQNVGGMISPNFETIAELNPDLILVTVEGNSKEDFAKLESLGYKLFVTNPRTIEDISTSILTIGRILGRDASAARLVRSMRGQEETIHSLVRGEKKPKVFAIISTKPLITAGPSTFIHQLIEKAGGTNIAEDATLPYPIYSREEVFHQQPEYLVVTTDAVQMLSTLFSEFPEWENMPAIKRRHVLLVNSDIVTRPGPRIIEGLEIIARVLHPDKFKEYKPEGVYRLLQFDPQ